MDEFYGYAPGTTKMIKSKPEKLHDMKDVDGGSTRFPHGTFVYKVSIGLEYRGKVQGCNPNKKLYHIVYDNGDTTDYYHNEVRDYCAKNVKQYPHKKRWQKNLLQSLISYFMQKYAPKEADHDEHTPPLSVEDIQAIASICYDDDNIDMSEDAIPSELIKICINILNSDPMTSEKQSLQYFTWKKLKRLLTWQEWKDGESKQLEQLYVQKMLGDQIDADTLPEAAYRTWFST